MSSPVLYALIWWPMLLPTVLISPCSLLLELATLVGIWGEQGSMALLWLIPGLGLSLWPLLAAADFLTGFLRL